MFHTQINGSVNWEIKTPHTHISIMSTFNKSVVSGTMPMFQKAETFCRKEL